jgi:hypothetical protein
MTLHFIAACEKKRNFCTIPMAFRIHLRSFSWRGQITWWMTFNLFTFLSVYKDGTWITMYRLFSRPSSRTCKNGNLLDTWRSFL